MTERVYTDRPALYDAVQADWDYDRDVGTVLELLADHGVQPEGGRLLELGCGTGEHTRRLVGAGLDVLAVDPHRGMLRAARGKCDARFCRAALPALPLDGEFDAAVAVRGVLNHLPPGDLAPALSAVHDRLPEGGAFVFDNSPLPPEGNRPGMDVGTVDGDRYVRVARHAPREDGRLDWQSVTFTPEEVVLNSRPMTPFADETVRAALRETGFDVRTRDGYGPGDERTVFVAVARATPGRRRSGTTGR
jgi:SAM-dependent methyltransferase